LLQIRFAEKSTVFREKDAAIRPFTEVLT